MDTEAADTPVLFSACRDVVKLPRAEAIALTGSRDGPWIASGYCPVHQNQD